MIPSFLETHHFEVVNTEMSWSDARTYCKNLNGDLASFSSAEEVEKVSFSIPVWYWVGLNKEVGETWAWSDGSSVTWMNWGLGQPNKASSCALLKRGLVFDRKLYDWPCDEPVPFICKTSGMY